MLSLTIIFTLTLIQYIHKTAFVSACFFSPHSFRAILKVFFQMHTLPEKTLGHQKDLTISWWSLLVSNCQITDWSAVFVTVASWSTHLSSKQQRYSLIAAVPMKNNTLAKEGSCVLCQVNQYGYIKVISEGSNYKRKNRGSNQLFGCQSKE